ncbi:MAG TPA: SDR family oxidoreductase [Burkholderiales bacterium]|nr:SDR family oxidoreductase [Burkholderiales bacterium]
MTRYEDVQKGLRTHARTWLVTGAAGFIGSNLLEALLKLEQRVVGLDNFSSGNPGNLAQVKDAVRQAQWKNFRFIEGDIRTPGTCGLACRSVEVVLHQAAIGSVPQTIADPVSAHEANVTGFLNMLMAARDAGVLRFVYASSSAAYGDDPGLPQVESQIGRPLSPYGLTKHVNELYAGIFARCYGLGSIGLRYFNVFGPRQDPNGAYAAVIPKWVADMIRNDPVFINGDGETVRDFCHVDNVVQANLLAATVDDSAAIDQVYNIALGERITLNQLFETIRSLLELRYPHLHDLHPTYREFRAGDVRLSQADIGKAGRLLGYRPVQPVSEGLACALDWYVAKLAPRRSVQNELPRAEAALSES